MQTQQSPRPCPLCGYLMDVFDPVCPRCRGDAGYVVRMEEEARRLRVRRWCLGGAKILVGVALVAVLLPPGLRMARQHLRGQPQPPVHGSSGGMAAAPAAQASPPTSTPDARAAEGLPVDPDIAARLFSDTDGIWTTPGNPAPYAEDVAAHIMLARNLKVREMTMQNDDLVHHREGRGGQNYDEGTFAWVALAESPNGTKVVLTGTAYVMMGGTDQEQVLVQVTSERDLLPY